MKLIDKDSVVAEIERRRNTWRYGSSTEAKYRMEEREEILDFINSIETIVEVEIDEYAKTKGNNKPKQQTLEVGEYFIPDDCTAKFVGRTVLVYKRKSKKLATTEYRCKDCKHRVKGRTFRRQHYDTMVCELKPKEENGLFYCAPLYGKPCEVFERKEE